MTNVSTKIRILELAKAQGGIRPHDLVRALQMSHAGVHKHLRELVAKGQLERRGKAPHVVYIQNISLARRIENTLPEDLAEKINNSFSYFTPTGEELSGELGFKVFLQATNQAKDPTARAKEYLKILHEAEKFRGSNGLIDGTQKIINTFEECYLTKLFYSDFYSLPKYGKTKLGQYLLHGKSGQNQGLIRLLAEKTKANLEAIISEYSIEALAFVPHSIPRQLPFLKEYRLLLKLPLPEIFLFKAFSQGIPIAQKSLSKLSERIQNAQQTIFLKHNDQDYKRILIIDDAIGSGATLNEVARKLKRTGTQVFGYAIVGSYKGFEVIKEI